MSAAGAAACGVGGLPVLSAQATPSSVNGSRSGPGSSTVTSDISGAVTSGGVAPYSYSWAKLSGDTLVINSPTLSSTSFSASMSGDTTLNSVYRCTVTDAIGQIAVTDVSVILTSTSGA